MGIKEWLQSKKEQKNLARTQTAAQIDDEVGKLWTKCYNCGANLPAKEVEENLHVCPKCGYHFRINATERIKQVMDLMSFKEINAGLGSVDPLNFKDLKPYKSRQKEAQTKTKLNDAIITGTGKINGESVAVAVMEFAFMGGSMGIAVGEGIIAAAHRAL